MFLSIEAKDKSNLNFHFNISVSTLSSLMLLRVIIFELLSILMSNNFINDFILIRGYLSMIEQK